MDKVIDKSQVELVVSAKPIVSIIEPVVVATKSFQLVQLEVEPIQIENPPFLKFQLVLIFGHSPETLR